MPDTPRDLLFLLHDVAQLIRLDADRRASFHGLTRAQWMLLIWLERRPGITQKELADIIEVEPITIARLIDRLESSGLVERRPDPADRRIWRLHLLSPAQPVLDDMAVERADMLATASQGIDRVTLDSTMATLLLMKANIVAERQDCASVRQPQREKV